jgi:hypothetical protein
MDREIEKAILSAQVNEITEHFVYSKLSESVRDLHNQSILKRISEDELRHYDLWKKYTHQNVRPIKWKKWMYYLASRLLGITFGIISITKGISFKKRFFEMAAISLGIAALTFAIGSVVGEISGLHP